MKASRRVIQAWRWRGTAPRLTTSRRDTVSNANTLVYQQKNKLNVDTSDEPVWNSIRLKWLACAIVIAGQGDNNLCGTCSNHEAQNFLPRSLSKLSPNLRVLGRLRTHTFTTHRLQPLTLPCLGTEIVSWTPRASLCLCNSRPEPRWNVLKLERFPIFCFVEIRGCILKIPSSFTLLFDNPYCWIMKIFILCLSLLTIRGLCKIDEPCTVQPVGTMFSIWIITADLTFRIKKDVRSL